MEAITNHRYVEADGLCGECDEPKWKHWYTERHDSPEEMEMLEAMFDD
jgi:hypothetical protein